MAKKWSWQNSVRAGGRGSGRATPGTCGDLTSDRGLNFFNFIYLIEVNCRVISLSVQKTY